MTSLKGSKIRASRALHGLVLFLLFCLIGCRTNSSSQDWSYRGATKPKGDEISARIDFLEKRLESRPRAFLEMAELAGLYLQRGKSRRRESDMLKSDELVERSLEEFPNPNALMVKADLFQTRHKFDEALEVLQEIREQRATNLEAVALEIKIRIAQGQADKAKGLLDQVPDSPLSSIVFLRGQVAEVSGDTSEARRLYESSIQRETDGASPGQAAQRRGVLARLEISEGNWARAQALLEAAHSIPVEQPLTETLRAEVLSHQGNYREAEQLLRASFEHYRDPVFLLRLGEVEQLAGKQKAARQTFETAAQLLKNDNLGHERDLALVLFYLDPEANAAEIKALMERELRRRQDAETLRVRDLVEADLGAP